METCSSVWLENISLLSVVFIVKFEQLKGSYISLIIGSGVILLVMGQSDPPRIAVSEALIQVTGAILIFCVAKIVKSCH